MMGKKLSNEQHDHKGNGCNAEPGNIFVHRPHGSKQKTQGSGKKKNDHEKIQDAAERSGCPSFQQISKNRSKDDAVEKRKQKMNHHNLKFLFSHKIWHYCYYYYCYYVFKLYLVYLSLPLFQNDFP